MMSHNVMTIRQECLITRNTNVIELTLAVLLIIYESYEMSSKVDYNALSMSHTCR